MAVSLSCVSFYGLYSVVDERLFLLFAGSVGLFRWFFKGCLAFKQWVAGFFAMTAEMGELAIWFVADSSIVVGKTGLGRWFATCGTPKRLVTASVVVVVAYATVVVVAYATVVVGRCFGFHHVEHFFMDFLPWQRVLPGLQAAETGVVVAPHGSSILCL